MCPVHRQVLCDEVAVADEMMLFHDHRPEIVLDDAENVPQTSPTLWAGGMVHHVLGHQVVEH